MDNFTTFDAEGFSILYRIDNEIMYLLYRKCLKEGVVYTDLTALSVELGLHRDTVKKMIPFEDGDMIIVRCDVVKSRRGKR